MRKHMKLNKKGVSLAILVITLMIMLILTSTIIIELADMYIMGKTNSNVVEINLKQVKSLANIAWTEAFVSDNIRTGEQYEEHIKKELTDSGIDVNEYEIMADSSGVIITLKGEGVGTTNSTDVIDVEKPTVQIELNQTSISQGADMLITLVFEDNNEIAVIDLSTEDIVLNGFTATKEISGEGFMRVVTLSNVQGDSGEKTITINGGVVIDESNNTSDETTSPEFVLEI